MPTQQWQGKWFGGRIRKGRDGPVYVLECMFERRRYSIRLDSTTEDDAMLELRAFRRDPIRFAGENKKQIVNNGRLAAAYAKYLEDRGLSATYRNDAVRYLGRWMRLFKMRPISSFSLAELQEFLSKNEPRGRLIVVLKSFTKFLRTRGLLTRISDPTWDLAVPPVVPAKSVRPKAYKMGDVEKLYAGIRALHPKIAQAIRDVVLTLALTGMHFTELKRLCASGEESIECLTHPTIAAVIRVWHKNGRIHSQSIDARTLKALLRLRNSGLPSICAIYDALDSAAKTLLLPEVNLGALRHSFATWAKEQGVVIRPQDQGVPLEIVAEVLGHNPKTNKDFYQHATPVLITIPIKLEHPEDPK